MHTYNLFKQVAGCRVGGQEKNKHQQSFEELNQTG